jgi:tetratricopeptide (TPR) repeat protein
VSHPPISLDTELGAARRALAAGDPEHAAFHLASALTFGPTHEEALRLFDEIIAAADDPESLLELGEAPYYGEVAARAYVLAHSGDVDQGFGLLAQVIRSFPNLGYEPWAEEWLTGAEADRIDPTNVARLVASLMQATVGRMHLRETEVHFLERFVPLARAGCATGPGADLPILLSMGSGLLRRVREYDDAIALADRALELEESPVHAVAGALARRGAGDFAGAEAGFARALELEQDATYWVEIARVRWDARDLDGALAALAEYTVLEPKDDDPETRVMIDYLRCCAHGEQEGRILVEWLGEDAAPDDVVQLVRPGGRLVPLSEATINAIRNAGDQMDLHGAEFSFGVSCIEAPSVRLAVALATGQESAAAIEYSFDNVPEPDPRRAVRDVAHRVWDYDWPDGKKPLATADPPSSEVRNTLAELAASRFFALRWWQRAGRIARSMGPDDLSSLLGAMVHPSLPPRDVGAWDWLRYVQVAAAFVIGHLDDGWQGSLRRRVLLDLADGPVDWVVDAALCALVEIALDEPTALEEIAAYFERFDGRLPDEGHWSCREVVAVSYLRLPGRPAHMREHFEAVLDDIYAEDEEEDD